MKEIPSAKRKNLKDVKTCKSQQKRKKHLKPWYLEIVNTTFREDQPNVAFASSFLLYLIYRSNNA